MSRLPIGEESLKGLIVDEPWISKILSGEKTWEMRKTACHQRGLIALIRKGSKRVAGVANVIGSMPALASLDEYRAAEPKHGIPVDRQTQAFIDGWRTPWVLDSARPLAQPVPYEHPPGAVIWVNLSDLVADTVLQQIQTVRSQTPEIPAEAGDSDRNSHVITANVAAGNARDVRLTGGNIRNQHIYLPLDFFPTDTLGGPNKEELAPQAVTLTFRPGSTINTDIDRSKRIFRSRSAVREFFIRAALEEGDIVRIERVAPYNYECSKVAND